MKKRILTMSFIMALSAPAFADMCSDILNQYAAMLTRLESDTMNAIAQTTDPTLQQALMDSYNWQKQMLIQQEQMTLQAYGCTTTTGGGTPTPTPVPTATPAPTATPVPTPTVGGDPGPGPGTGGTTCKDVTDRIHAETMGMPMSEKVKCAHRHKKEIDDACGNYGTGNSQLHHDWNDDRRGGDNDRDDNGHRH